MDNATTAFIAAVGIIIVAVIQGVFAIYIRKLEKNVNAKMDALLLAHGKAEGLAGEKRGREAAELAEFNRGNK